MLTVTQIHSLTDFLRNHKAHVNWLKKNHLPEVLTINGKAELVVMDTESYQALVDKQGRVVATSKDERNKILDMLQQAADEAEKNDFFEDSEELIKVIKAARSSKKGSDIVLH